jgi:hypothetical protein
MSCSHTAVSNAVQFPSTATEVAGVILRQLTLDLRDPFGRAQHEALNVLFLCESFESFSNDGRAGISEKERIVTLPGRGGYQAWRSWFVRVFRETGRRRLVPYDSILPVYIAGIRRPGPTIRKAHRLHR